MPPPCMLSGSCGSGGCSVIIALSWLLWEGFNEDESWEIWGQTMLNAWCVYAALTQTGNKGIDLVVGGGGGL